MIGVRDFVRMVWETCVPDFDNALPEVAQSRYKKIAKLTWLLLGPEAPVLEKRKIKLKRDWEGAVVQFKKEMKNGYSRYPKGTTATVVKSWKGLEVWIEPCEHCGCRNHMSGIQIEDVEYIGHPIADVRRPD